MAQRRGRVALVFVMTGLALGCHGKESDRGALTKRTDRSPQTDADRAFWNWFVDHAPALAKERSMSDVMKQVQRELKKLDRGVIAEIGSAGDDRLLVLSADGDRKVFPMVQQLFAARPAVKGWKIVAFRQREAKRPMPVLSMNDRKLDPATLRYLAVRDHQKLDIQLYVPRYVEGDEAIGLLALLALDHTVGEYDVETKLGAIDLLPIERAPANAHELDDLVGEIDAIGTAPAH